MTSAAIWARVSTTDQHTENQLAKLRAWAERRGLDVAAEFITEDSAWDGNGKGAEFDKARRELLAGARRGNYSIVLVWAIDRLSRRGPEDTLAIVRQLTESGCQVWSDQEPWVEDIRSPAMREFFLMVTGWMAKQESERRSERIKAGLARRKAAGLPVGGELSKRGKDRKPRRKDGYYRKTS
jgi:DNA invertase Pin-like site-specific DNA recombinase